MAILAGLNFSLKLAIESFFGALDASGITVSSVLSLYLCCRVVLLYEEGRINLCRHWSGNLKNIKLSPKGCGIQRSYLFSFTSLPSPEPLITSTFLRRSLKPLWIEMMTPIRLERPELFQRELNGSTATVSILLTYSPL